MEEYDSTLDTALRIPGANLTEWLIDLFPIAMAVVMIAVLLLSVKD
jgi:hypothetical protein